MAKLCEDRSVTYSPIEIGYFTIDELDTSENQGFLDELFETGSVTVTYEGNTYELTLTAMKVTSLDLTGKTRDAL